MSHRMTYDDLKAENNRLRAFSDEKVRENGLLKECSKAWEDAYNEALQRNIELTKQLIDLRKAIEEIDAHSKKVIAAYRRSGNYDELALQTLYYISDIVKQALEGNREGKA